ncbi:LytR/AlgR family response regulator transcription factor [Enterococcus nangangensis]
MHLALVEDDAYAQANFTQLLTQLTLPFPVTVTTFSSGEEFLFALPENNFDGLFLDIQLAGLLNGMDVAKRIRQINPDLPLVFLSNYDDYVFDGYDVGALSYIMKPITPDKLTQILLKLNATTEKPSILIKSEAGFLKIPLFEILYFEVSGHTLKIVTQKETHLTNTPLSSFKEQLTPSFLAVHRSFTINLAQVVSFNGQDILMKDGATIPVARSQKQKVKTAFLEHYRRLADENK